jgi:hypothetical protein
MAVQKGAANERRFQEIERETANSAPLTYPQGFPRQGVTSIYYHLPVLRVDTSLACAGMATMSRVIRSLGELVALFAIGFLLMALALSAH